MNFAAAWKNYTVKDIVNTTIATTLSTSRKWRGWCCGSTHPNVFLLVRKHIVPLVLDFKLNLYIRKLRQDRSVQARA